MLKNIQLYITEKARLLKLKGESSNNSKIIINSAQHSKIKRKIKLIMLSEKITRSCGLLKIPDDAIKLEIANKILCIIINKLNFII